MKKKKIIICVLALFGFLIAIGLLSGYWYLQHFSQKTIHLSQPDQVFTLKRGTTVSQLVKQVQQESLIGDDAYLIPYLIKISPALQNIKSGTYPLSSDMTIAQFLQLLNSGKEIQFSVKFVEGKRAKDWVAILEATQNIDHTLATSSLDEISKQLGIESSIEGWLYPDTYYYTTNASDLTILKRAHAKMQNALQVVWDDRDNNLPYKTPYELLIMASIIEKETGVDTERGKVSSVFVNRLRIKMRLQTDPTVMYGMGDDYTGQLTKKDLRNQDNIYNTYVISGLPPTPIAMPSLASLEAAAHPDQTNYLYFVADGNGGHTFTTNLKDHNSAVTEYWRIMRERRQ